jgi:ABC-2 type transport system ATP-binding protein
VPDLLGFALRVATAWLLQLVTRANRALAALQDWDVWDDARVADPAVSVKGLKKRYGDYEAVKGIDFEIAVGECFGFLGPNGAGKTTTIEMLEGYRKRTAGEVAVLGEDPGHPSRQWRERVGLVLQECELNAVLTVRELVSQFATYYRNPRPVDETIDLVGLEEKRDARVGSLSGGQRRRVDVAVGIIGDPELIFLDEPTTGFDPAARRQAWNMLEGLKELGKTIFLTTHYMDEATHLADRVAVLVRGQLAAIGSPDELGAGKTELTVIGFRMPDSAKLAEVEAAAGSELDVSGSQVTIRVKDPQPVLHKLLSWADSNGARLGGLEVRRPSLEDVFLELTGEEGGA